MRSHRGATPRHTGWLILGLLAIPFASVSGAAVVADVASTTDPAAALAGLPATFGGVLVGLCGLRLARTVRAGLSAVGVALNRLVGSVGAVPSPAVTAFSVRPAQVAAPAFVPASIGRRGPPSQLR